MSEEGNPDDFGELTQEYTEPIFFDGGALANEELVEVGSDVSIDQITLEKGDGEESDTELNR